MPTATKIHHVTHTREVVSLLEPANRRALERGELTMGALADFGAPPLDPEMLRELRRNVSTYTKRAKVRAR